MRAPTPLLAATAFLLLLTQSTANFGPEMSDDLEPYGCSDGHGSVLALGQMNMTVANGSCTIIQCREQGLETMLTNCRAPACVNPVRELGACCVSCPDGPNCRLPSGAVLTGDDVQDDGEVRCRCPSVTEAHSRGAKAATAMCHPVTAKVSGLIDGTWDQERRRKPKQTEEEKRMRRIQKRKERKQKRAEERRIKNEEKKRLAEGIGNEEGGLGEKINEEEMDRNLKEPRLSKKEKRERNKRKKEQKRQEKQQKKKEKKAQQKKAREDKLEAARQRKRERQEKLEAARQKKRERRKENNKRKNKKD